MSSRSGLVQVWFSLQPKFNSFELDSEVERLVVYIFMHFLSVNLFFCRFRMTINGFTSHVAPPSDLKLLAAGLSKFIYDFEVNILCQ